MKKFLFITHLTPKQKRSSLRDELIGIMYRSLCDQTYGHWNALWIGEEERNDGRIKEVNLSGIGAEERNENLARIYERPDVQALFDECDYIVKLDDDDLISKYALERASALEFDCYCDQYHTFYDLSSGIVTQQKRPWIASTAIHKKTEVLLTPICNEPTRNLFKSIFYTEHDKVWIRHYENKRLVYADRKHPLYLRILSPTSITAGGQKLHTNEWTAEKASQYHTYLNTFGAWNRANAIGFEDNLALLTKAWENFSGTAQKPVSGIPLVKKIKDWLRFRI